MLFISYLELMNAFFSPLATIFNDIVSWRLIMLITKFNTCQAQYSGVFNIKSTLKLYIGTDQ
ncbi:hypothetical protein Bresa_01374|uniref:Uncharacterized protein n=1 Tax=Brenneria salicis ATCC 15712 = DSM 30166 TaxID=714314 RepID=A0A366I0Y7_9GAMM|nr:hypothetical protein [Brenneria salicis ATCC 15712 = DSM 30166]RBP60451.1 hypothetical protein DES54_13143 [Brenneria salicis ATCC 15712 = DSM 30166]RLM30078.1 hypothetical protein BHG07_12810 [Brenneria salicis ATCC 15712 = DSM 30166]